MTQREGNDDEMRLLLTQCERLITILKPYVARDQGKFDKIVETYGHFPASSLPNVALDRRLHAAKEAIAAMETLIAKYRSPDVPKAP